MADQSTLGNAVVAETLRDYATWKGQGGERFLPFDEAVAMMEAGRKHHLTDPTIMFSLARAEGGTPGKEMGFGPHLNKPELKTKEAQYDRAARQLALTEQRFQTEFGRPPADENGNYVSDFLKYFSWGGKVFGHATTLYQGYAPLNAHDTDPTRLNNNHFMNLKRGYYGSKP